MKRFAAVFSLCVMLAPGAAWAGQGAERTRNAFEAPGAAQARADARSFIEEGVAELSGRLAAKPGDNEMQYGLGMLLFGRAVER